MTHAHIRITRTRKAVTEDCTDPDCVMGKSLCRHKPGKRCFYCGSEPAPAAKKASDG